MEIKYDIPDNKLQNFTDSAKHRLEEQSQHFTLEIIKEAKTVGDLLKENGAAIEITDSTIVQAIRRNKTHRQKSLKIIIFKIVSEILLFISGFMFLPDVFVNTETHELNMFYFIVFLLVTFLAISATIITYFLGGE